MISVTLNMLVGAALGFVWTSLLLATQPLARERVDGRYVLLLTLTTGVLTWSTGRYDAWTTHAVLTSAAAGLVGVGYAWLVERGGDPTQEDDPLLLEPEIRRSKTEHDRWVLVVGPEGSGKATLVDEMISAALDGPSAKDGLRWNWRMSGRRVQGHSDGHRVTEIPVTRGSNEHVLRFWEQEQVPSVTDQHPAFHEIDAVIVIADPTQLPETSRTFPPGIRSHVNGSHDVNMTLVDVEAAAERTGARPRVWFVVTKADLLPFSIHPLLVQSVRLGPAWHSQLQMMLPHDREAIVDTLGARRANETPAHFSWGAASPLLVCAAPSGRPHEGFGQPQLIDLVVSAL